MARRLAAAFGRRLRALRIERGLSQEGLAERASLSLNAVGSFERGQRFPRAASIEALVKALDVEPERFFGGLAGSAQEPPGAYQSRHAPSPPLDELVRLLPDLPPKDHLLVLDIVRRLLAMRD